MLVWTETEVLDGLTGILWTSQQQSVATSWCAKCQLIEGQSLTTCSKDASTSSGSEAESSNTELWNGQETVVIGDGTNDDNGLVVGLLGNVGGDSREGDWWSVDAGHEKSAENDLVEGGLGTTSKEAVELYQELEVDIVALWSLAVSAAHMVGVEIDT